jgi:hypothetical protein
LARGAVGHDHQGQSGLDVLGDAANHTSGVLAQEGS